jgi:hypothetical protein
MSIGTAEIGRFALGQISTNHNLTLSCALSSSVSVSTSSVLQHAVNLSYIVSSAYNLTTVLHLWYPVDLAYTSIVSCNVYAGRIVYILTSVSMSSSSMLTFYIDHVSSLAYTSLTSSLMLPISIEKRLRYYEITQSKLIKGIYKTIKCNPILSFVIRRARPMDLRAFVESSFYAVKLYRMKRRQPPIL